MYKNSAPQALARVKDCLIPFPKLFWRYSCVLFEILSEGELFGEAQLVGHLLDLYVRLR